MTRAAAPTVVFVHGRGQEFKDPEALFRTWLGALNAGLTQAGQAPLPADRAVLPFYGNVLYRITAESAGRQVRLESIGDEPGPFHPGLPPETGTLERELLADMDRNAPGTGRARAQDLPEEGLHEEGFRERLLSWGAARRVLAALAKRSRVDQLVIQAQLRDVAIYLTQGRQEVLKTVRAGVPDDGPLVLVTHSLGTVVGRDLLHDDDVRARTVLWVTLGSPLGLEAVQNNLLAKGCRHPGTDWLTAYDVNDFVALGHPLAKAWGAPLVDVDVENGLDPHAIVRYLAHEQVAAPIGQAAAGTSRV